jgi:hypothetical protein
MSHTIDDPFHFKYMGYCWNDAEKKEAMDLFNVRFEEKLKRSKNIEFISEDIDPVKNKKNRQDSFGRRMIGKKLSDAIKMLQGFQDEYGDLMIKKISYLNMGLCLCVKRKETDDEKKERVCDILVKEITDIINEKAHKRCEIERLQNRIYNLSKELDK